MMNRREFMHAAGGATAVGAALRYGNLSAAEDNASAAQQGSGLKTAIYNVREYGVKGDEITDDSGRRLRRYDQELSYPSVV